MRERKKVEEEDDDENKPSGFLSALAHRFT